MKHLSTDFDIPSEPLQEYSRPQMARDNYTMLNGLWDLSFDRTPSVPDRYGYKIKVPFSPESEASGLKPVRKLMPGRFLHYRRFFDVKKEENEHILLHFEAVDQYALITSNSTSDLTTGSVSCRNTADIL